VRTAEVAWLYDPIRSNERQAVDTWISRVSPDFGWRVRRNYPYRGNADGHTTALRRQFAERDYIGIELEVNQAILSSPAAIRQVAERLQAIHVPPE
jgi:predicted N-formylglutamate amidohydrolase